MRGVVLHCPSCKKLLARNVFLRIGSYFSMKCFHCGKFVDISAGLDNIEVKSSKDTSTKSMDETNLTDREDDGIVFLNDKS